jgi:hypothetical protein
MRDGKGVARVASARLKALLQRGGARWQHGNVVHQPVFAGLPEPKARLNPCSKVLTPVGSTICAMVAA